MEVNSKALLGIEEGNQTSSLRKCFLLVSDFFIVLPRFSLLIDVETKLFDSNLKSLLYFSSYSI